MQATYRPRALFSSSRKVAALAGGAGGNPQYSSSSCSPEQPCASSGRLAGVPGQASSLSSTPSPSSSPSQALPKPSASLSSWSALAINGQLSAASATPSPSSSR